MIHYFVKIHNTCFILSSVFGLLIIDNTEVPSVCPEHDDGEPHGEEGGGGEGGGGAPEVPLVTQRRVAQAQGVPLQLCNAMMYYH